MGPLGPLGTKMKKEQGLLKHATTGSTRCTEAKKVGFVLNMGPLGPQGAQRQKKFDSL